MAEPPSELDAIPDLDVPTAPSRQEASAAPTPSAEPRVAPPTSAPAGPLSGYFGSGEFELDDSGAPLELHEGAEAAAPRLDLGAELHLDEGPVAPSLETATVASPEGPAPTHVALPTGITPEPASLRPEARELADFAAYPALPTSALQAPLYALRVLLRRRALTRSLAQELTLLERAEHERDELLADCARRQRPALQAVGELALELPAIDALSLETQQQRQRSAQTHQAHAQALEALARDRAALEAEDRRAQLARAPDDARLAEAEQALQRAEARAQRANIELRNAVAAVHEAQARNTSPTEAQRATFQEKQAAVADAEARLAPAREAALAARRIIGEHDAAAQRRAQAARALGTQERQLEQQFRLLDATQSAAFERAAGRERQAWANLLRQALQRRHPLPLAPATLEALRAADAQVLAAATRHALVLAALDAADDAQVRRGLGVGAAALLALALLCGALLLLLR